MNFLSLLGLGGRKAQFNPSVEHITQWYSNALQRNVWFDIYLPPGYYDHRESYYPLLIFNDGQDLPRMNFKQILHDLYAHRAIPPMIVVGIHANEERLREYGVIRQPDYKGRGDKAPLHRDFVTGELLPFIRSNYPISDTPNDVIMAGFSLGGLSALDIAWSAPDVFGGAGVFSGALWWRWEDVRPEDPDGGRIMHDTILNSSKALHTKQFFWFMAGTGDEDEDRNNNGVIDAIDDTVHCIESMETIGLRSEQLRYVEIQDGTHDPATWGKAMPDFLDWMFNESGGGM